MNISDFALCRPDKQRQNKTKQKNIAYFAENDCSVRINVSNENEMKLYWTIKKSKCLEMSEPLTTEFQQLFIKKVNFDGMNYFKSNQYITNFHFFILSSFFFANFGTYCNYGKSQNLKIIIFFFFFWILFEKILYVFLRKCVYFLERKKCLFGNQT